MKKLTAWLLVCILCLTGCSAKSSSQAMTIYKMYYQLISESTNYIGESQNYALSYEVKEDAEGTYNYYIFVDSPTVAMYDVVVMAVENDISYDANVKMVPSIGIFDGKYNLVPNQINKKKGYVKGLMISGESDMDTIHLKILVEWKNKKRDSVTREFHNVELTKEGYSYVDTSLGNSHS